MTDTDGATPDEDVVRVGEDDLVICTVRTSFRVGDNITVSERSAVFAKDTTLDEVMSWVHGFPGFIIEARLLRNSHARRPRAARREPTTMGAVYSNYQDRKGG